MSSKSCLVIGGCGFLGSYAVESLLDTGYRVRVFDRHDVSLANLKDVAGRLELVYGDLANPAEMRAACAGVDTIFHFAYTTVPKTAAANPVFDLSSNLLPLVQLLEHLAQASPATRLVYVSSGGTVYGQADSLPLAEDAPRAPLSAYGMSKTCCENYLDFYGRRKGLDLWTLRMSNPYGPRQSAAHPQGVVAHFLKGIQEDGQVELWGDGGVVRDFFFAPDLRGLFPRLVEQAPGEEGVFNIGSGVGTSLLDLVEALRAVIPKDFQLIHKDPQGYDAQANVLDVERARRLLGYGVSTTLQDGLRETWDWLQSTAP